MKNRIEIIIIMSLLIGFSLFTALNDKTISYEERRYLAKFPNIKSKTFFDDLDKYLTDHFVFRNDFRKMKANISNNILLMKDMNGVFDIDGYIFEIDDRIDEKSVNNITNTINEIKDKYFKNQDAYMFVIPRKNDYLANPNPLDYKYQDIFKMIEDKLDIETISLYDELSLDSYYKTDIHFRQNKLDKVVDKIFDVTRFTQNEVDYKYNTFSPFYGALYSKAATNMKADELVYMTSDKLEGISVYDLEKNKQVPIYDVNELGKIDSYNVYVDGPSAYLEIINDNVDNGQELIIFRDSYTSSLLPLLMPSFEKIQVVDLRYYNKKLLDNLDFSDNAKVLFIYGLEVINNSYSIK